MPLIAVSRLELLAAGAKGRVCALLDAGRGEFYCGQYLDGMGLGEGLLPMEGARVTALEADAVVVCEETVAAAFAGMTRMQMVADPTAADALPIVLKRFESGSFEDAMTLDANYLRRTDAEIFAPKTGSPKVAAKLEEVRQAD